MQIDLNEEQRVAAGVKDGPALVIAGAGTGKTATLAARLVQLVESGVPPEHVLLLTFTRRASLEMIDRAGRMLGRADAPFSGGTFHSFSSVILRQFGDRLGLADSFTILDQDDVSQIIGILRSDCPGSRERRFPKSRTIAAILSRAVNTRRPVGAVVMEDYRHFTHAAAQLDQLAVAYVRWKADRGLIDFDDLLHLLIVLLRSHPDVRKQVCNRWRYLMVDEYQDTNALQAEIVDLLASEHENVMVVGDDAQSIYAFRGARHENLYLFGKRFTAARQIVLERNYRSTQPILDLSNLVLEQMRKSFRKRLYTERSDGVVPTLVRTASHLDEAQYVGRRIQDAHKKGTSYSDFAVIFRSGRQAYALEAELQALGIPFVKYGGLRFADSAHVKDVTSLLRMLGNSRDSLSLQRVLAWAPGVGRTTAGRIEWELDGKLNGGALRKCTHPRKAADFINRLAGSIDHWQRLASSDPQKVVEEALEFYQPLLEERFDDWPKRKKDLDALASLAKDAETLTEFVETLSLDPPASPNLVDDPLPDGGRVTLSTIHSAKGLEWSRVFVIRAHEGSLPMTMDPSISAMDEELRLLYVAVTRAADELILTWPEDQDGRNAGASRFLRDVAHAKLARETTPAAGKVSPRGRHGGDWRQSITW